MKQDENILLLPVLYETNTLTRICTGRYLASLQLHTRIGPIALSRHIIMTPSHHAFAFTALRRRINNKSKLFLFELETNHSRAQTRYTTT